MGSIHRRKGSKWRRIQWIDGWGKPRTKTLKGITDEKIAAGMLAKLEEQAAFARLGIIDPADEKYQREGRRPIKEQIDYWQALLRSEKKSESYDVHETNAVRRVMKAANVHRLIDIVPGDIKRTVGLLPMERGEGEMSARRKNAILTACKMFCEQMRRDGKLRVNPLLDLKGWDQETDKRRQHVAYDQELAWAVIAAAQASTETVEKLTGPQRAMLYELTWATGFRKRTCAELTVAHLHLRAQTPFIQILPTNVKNKKARVHTVSRDLAQKLAAYTHGMKPTQRLFPINAKRDNTAAMMRHDLASIGVDYEASPTEVRDFHSWRNTFGTDMGRSGSSFKVVQDMMGHSTPVLTARYMRPTLADYSDAVERLPQAQGSKRKQGKRTA